MDKPLIRVGVAMLMMNRAGQFVLGLCKNKLRQSSTWAIPGGHLEFGEDFIACAKREAMEETRLTLEHVEVAAVANQIFSAEKHYVTIYCIGLIAGDEAPQLLEPDKCEGWSFFDDWHNLPQPTFVDYLKELKPELITAYRQKHGLISS